MQREGPQITMKPYKRDPHREKFVRTFRNLLKDAGFDKEEIAIQGPTEEGPDIIVTHRPTANFVIKIIIQCKSSETPGKEYGPLNDLIRKYSSYVNEYTADVALLALEGYTIPPKFKDEKIVTAFKRKDKVVYWDDEVIRYYRDTVKTLGSPYSRYIILRDIMDFRLQLQTEPYVVDALQVRQHPTGEHIWIFSMEPAKLLNIAYVFRRASMDPRAYQRMLKDDRLRKIGMFLSKRDSMLANNLVMAFEENVKFSKGKLYIPAKTCSAWIIDGQHRLYGFRRLSEKLDEEEKKNVLKNYKLIVAGIKAKHRLQASLFREINEFQKKIDRNLLLDLYDYLDVDDDKKILLRIRIAKKLRKLPLFESKIKILRTEKGKITLANIVDYSRFIDTVKMYGNRSYTLLRHYFKAVKDTFPNEWENPKRYVFTTNKGIRMLLSLLTRIIWYCNNNNKKLNYENMKLCLEALKETCKAEKDYFLVKTYTGKALGAGSPDIAARDLWAARIDEKLGIFLLDHEKSLIAGHAERFLEALETRLRECIETQLKIVSKKDWWKERVPPDVRARAQERKIKNERVWPWYKAGDQPLVCYLDFSDYIKIIEKRDNWPVFKPIFRDQEIVVAKMKELKPIRDSIAHHRKLTVDMRERLKIYSTDLITCIDKALKK